MKLIKVGAAQLPVKLGEVEKNLQSAEKAIRDAAELGIEYLCFPELFITGYQLPRDVLHSLAEPLPGKITQRLMEASDKYGIYLVIGLPEKGDSGRIYNSAVITGPNGYFQKYRKNYLWADEQQVFAAGEELPIFETKHGKIGVLICYDLEFPENARKLALAGAEIIFYPSADMQPYKHRHDIFVQARAAENCIFIVGANRSDEEGPFNFFGHSQITGPDGECLVKASAGNTIVFATLDLEMVVKAKETMGYFKYLDY